MIIINPRQILFGDKKPCSGNCGMNYCDENGCVERKRNLAPVTQDVTDVPVSGTPVQTSGTNVPPSDELKQLWEEFAHHKRMRGKLASRTAIIVAEVEAKLRDTPLHELFLKGSYASPELKEHYAELQAMIMTGALIYDKIRHLEQHGKLPPSPEPPIDTVDIDALRHQIRRLDDLINKTTKKINNTSLNGKKSSRVAEWKEKLALAEAMRDDLRQKLKQRQHEARAQRTGTA